MSVTAILESVASGVLIVALVAAAKVVPRTLKANREYRAAAETARTALAARLDVQDAVLERIEGETRLNGGKSLKDSVIRSEAKMDALADKLDRHLEDAKYQQGRLDAFVAGAAPPR